MAPVEFVVGAAAPASEHDAPAHRDLNMAIFLALMAALSYGISDFAAGMASRKLTAGPVSAAVVVLTLLTAVVSVVLFPGDENPDAHVIWWGAASGFGSAVGTLALYHGLSVGRMSVVATLSAVLAAVIPAVVGVAMGDQLTLVVTIGILIAIPAIALVSWHPQSDEHGSAGAGVIYGVIAGLGFGLLFIALNQAGNEAGAWPVIPGQLVALVLVSPFAVRGLRTSPETDRATAGLVLAAGVLSGAAVLLFLAATGHGELAIIAVLTSLYPAATVVLARIFLSEHWTRLQIAGMCASVVAVVLVSVG